MQALRSDSSCQNRWRICFIHYWWLYTRNAYFSSFVVRVSNNASSSSSSPPTDSPSSSVAPNFTSSPTLACSWIVISIQFDAFSSDVSWILYRINGSNGGDASVTSHAIPTNTFEPYWKRGRRSSAHGGICYKFDELRLVAWHLLTTVHCFAEGGEFEASESSIFSFLSFLFLKLHKYNPGGVMGDFSQ